MSPLGATKGGAADFEGGGLNGKAPPVTTSLRSIGSANSRTEAEFVSMEEDEFATNAEQPTRAVGRKANLQKTLFKPAPPPLWNGKA
jgi:hypothetical protein